ncbi:MAG: lactonase family protein [Oscillochloris sp.]|nr:lactonase family protein [Oscillochloris sp.]
MSDGSTSLILVSGYAAADQPGIHAFTYHPTAGTLTPLGQYAGVRNPSFLRLHPAGHTLYAASEIAAGEVHALALSRDPWQLQPLNLQPSGGATPCHLAVTPDGCWVIAANYGGTVALLPIDDTGALGAPADVVQHQGNGPRSDRQDGPHCHSATISPDGRFAIVADLGADVLVIYRIDGIAGRLLRHDVVKAAPGAGPRHIAVHPDGRVMYVINELDCTVTVYGYDPVIGSLHYRQTIPTLPPGAPRSDAADIQVSPDGSRLYASNRGHNSIAIFAIDSDAMLREVALRPCGGDWPRNFALLPGNRHLLVANQHSNAVALLPLDDAYGVAAPLGRYAVPGAACIFVV